MLRFAPAPALLALLASPAAAHTTNLPHIHGAEAATWLVLGMAFIGAALMIRAKAQSSKRDRQ